MTREQNTAALAGAIRKLSAEGELAEDEPPRVVATFDSYAGMLEAIRARVHELQVNGERLDEYVGLPRGYYSKNPPARHAELCANPEWPRSKVPACSLRCDYFAAPLAARYGLGEMNNVVLSRPHPRSRKQAPHSICHAGPLYERPL
jgi:hypothetical protein